MLRVSSQKMSCSFRCGSLKLPRQKAEYVLGLTQPLHASHKCKHELLCLPPNPLSLA